MKHKEFLKEGRSYNKQYPKNLSRNKIMDSQKTKLRPSSKNYRNSLQDQNYKRMIKNPQQIMMIKTLIKQQLQLHDINEQITNIQQMSIQNLKHKILEKNKEIQIQRQKLALLYQNKKMKQKQLQFQQTNKQIKQLKKHIAKIYQCLKTKDLANDKQQYNTHKHYHYDEIGGQQSIINSEIIANLLSQSRQNNQKHINNVDKKIIVESEQNKRQKIGRLRRPPSYQLNGQNLQIKYTDSWVGELKKPQNQLQRQILKDRVRQKSSRDSTSIKNSSVRKNMNMVQSIINIQIGDASQQTINGSNKKLNKGLMKQDQIIQQSGLYEYSNSQHENRNQMNKSNLLSSINSNNELRKLKKQQNYKQNTSMVQQSIIHIQIPKESLKMPNNTNLCQSSPINSINQINDYHSSSSCEIHNNLAIEEEEEVLRNNNRIERVNGLNKNLTITISQLERQPSLIPKRYDQNYKSY